MAYKILSSRLYPFRRENAKFFSQELIENVLLDFGHIWKPQRSKRESQMREIASYVFKPCVGRLVAYVSRKYGGFVVMKCLNTWNYIVSHRPSVRERILCNAIVTLCVRNELENDDLGLLTFMAMTVEYARLALSHKHENLIETIVDALSFCLTDKIPGGFIVTIERMKHIASNFVYPRTYIFPEEYEPETRYTTPISTESVYTPRSEFESPIMLVPDLLPNAEYNTPMEEIEEEFKNREIYRDIFRRKMMSDCATQTEMGEDNNDNQSESIVIKSENSDRILKIEVKQEENSDSFNLDIVATYDVYVQTGNFNEDQLSSILSEGDKTVKSTLSGYSHPVDFNAVVDKLRHIHDIHDIKEENELLDKTEVECASSIAEKPEDGDQITGVRKKDSGRSSLHPTDLPHFVSLKDQKFENRCEPEGEKLKYVEDKGIDLGSLESQLQNVELDLGNSKDDTDINESLDDSQFGSLDVSSEHNSKIQEGIYLKKDYSFDSQIGSLDESIKLSDESHLENVDS